MARVIVIGSRIVVLAMMTLAAPANASDRNYPEIAVKPTVDVFDYALHAIEFAEVPAILDLDVPAQVVPEIMVSAAVVGVKEPMIHRIRPPTNPG